MSENLTSSSEGITLKASELHELLMDMSEEMREIMICYIRGYTTEEIARQRGMTAEEVQKTISHAIGEIKTRVVAGRPSVAN